MKMPALRAALAAFALLLGSASVPALAQTTVNLRDADIRAFIDDVARVTGATFVIDPRVQGKVSVVSDKPLGRNQYFELFLATLRANGYVAVPSGTGQYRVQPAEAGAGAGGARYSTAVIPLTNIDAQAAVDSLRPVLSRNGTASANRAGNAIIIADFADNIARARQVLREIDRDRSTTQVVQLRNAGARDLAQSLQRLVQQPGSEANAATAISVVPIDASNAIAIRGEANQVKRLAGIARDLDQKAAGGSESRVIFLQHADAAAVMPVLQQLMGQVPTPIQQGGGIAGLAGTPFGNRNPQQQQQQQQQAPQQLQQAAPNQANLGVAAGNSRRRAIIARYEGANALIIAAPPEIQRELGEVIRQLDTRRAQVHVEAIIVEISDTAARQLGVQFLLSGQNGAVPLMSSNFSNASPNLLAIAGAVAAERGVIGGAAAEQFRAAAVESLLGTSGLTSGIASLGANTIFGFVLNRTVFGKNTLAIGGNPEASRLAGVNVDRTRIWIFALQGLVCGIAGILLASRITSGQPNAAVGLELSVISACVLGGVSLAGGRATMAGVIVGVMIMGIAENVMNLLNIPAFYQYIVRGVILLLAVLLDNLRSSALGRR